MAGKAGTETHPLTSGPGGARISGPRGVAAAVVFVVPVILVFGGLHEGYERYPVDLERNRRIKPNGETDKVICETYVRWSR